MNRKLSLLMLPAIFLAAFGGMMYRTNPAIAITSTMVGAILGVVGVVAIGYGKDPEIGKGVKK